MSIRDELITPEQAATIRARLDAPETTNHERGELERFEIWRDTPDRLFLYVREDAEPAFIVWSGQVVSYGTKGRRYRSNFGDVRVPVWTRIAGVDYAGTYYLSAGDYCRLRRVKSSTLNRKG